jgi:hypothetical protein
MWWGGTSAPARFLVPIVPCLAPMIAIGFGALRSRAGRTLFGVCLLASLLVAAIGTGLPDRLLLFSDSRGYSRLLETIQAGAPFTFSLPTFTYEDWRSPILLLLPWLLAACLAGGSLLAAARWLRLDSLWLAAVAVLTLVSSANVLAGRPAPGARQELARRGALDLIWEHDDRLRAFDYAALRRIDETRVRELSRVTFDGYPVPGFALPEGAYEARIWFGGSLQRHGEIAVSSAQRVTFARSTGPFANPAQVPFVLPVAAGRLTVAVSDQSLAASVVRTEIVPTVLVSRGDREARPIRRIEEVKGREGAYLVYLDENSYPEGGVFWTRGSERTEVFVAPGRYSRIRLSVHLGPRSGDVKIVAPGGERTLRVAGNAVAEVQMDVPSGRPTMLFAIQSSTTFRPSEVDPRSDDGRMLGAQVRVDVE